MGVCMHVHACVHHSTHGRPEDDFVESVLSTFGGFWELNSGHQVSVGAFTNWAIMLTLIYDYITMTLISNYIMMTLIYDYIISMITS